MKKKDLILIIIAVILIGLILVIGANAEWIRIKLGIKLSSSLSSTLESKNDSSLESNNNQAGGNEQSNNESEAALNISVLSPKPEEIIKGTKFTVKGDANVLLGPILNIEIFNRQTGEIWLATTTAVIFSQGGQSGEFEKEIDVSPNSGLATLKVFSVFPQNGWIINLVSFPIRISPSI